MDKIVLEDGLDLNQLVTKGSLIRLNEEFLEDAEPHEAVAAPVDCFGRPVQSFEEFGKTLTAIDNEGYVKKQILEEGGGVELHDGCTVSVAYSGYWENEPEPFDVRSPQKPLVVDLKDNGLLPGLLQAVRSMLVGELSVFLLSYKVMYGEFGVPPRIKPKANCVFYINIIRSINTPKDGEIDINERNTFQRILHEANMLYSSGQTIFKTKNYNLSVKLFRKAVTLLERCRLADETEEDQHEKLLIKLYTNMAICYNKIKLPLRACTACNEVNRLSNIWKGNAKVLFQNAKALRMIGSFDDAEKRLLRAMHLKPNNHELESELQLLRETREMCNKVKLVHDKQSVDIISKEFKETVDTLIRNFKLNNEQCKLTLPSGLSPSEIDYVQEVCERENVFLNKVKTDYALDKEDPKIPIDGEDEGKVEELLTLD